MFFWNDETFFDRIKFGNKSLFTIDIPLYLFTVLIAFLILDDSVPFRAILLVALPTYMVIYGFIDIFLQLPHYRIPDSYSKPAKTILYILNFLIACMLFYFIVVGVLRHYYPWLNDYVCCDIVRNIPKI